MIHLAAKSFIPDCWKAPAQTIQTNFGGTLNALEFCRRRGARLIFTSAYVYGHPESLPISELHRTDTNNPYSFSKKIAEDLCRFYYEQYQTPVNIFRIFNIYGPGQRESFLIPTILKQINGGHIEVSDLAPRRDYLYIDDVVLAIELALMKEHEYFLLNLGSGRSYSVKDLVEMIIRLSGKDVTYSSRESVRENEILDTVADISASKKLLGWEPKISLEAGLLKLISSKDFI